jgi:hypothetical protein
MRRANDRLRRPAIPEDGRRSTLSFGERAGVRGNWTHAISTGSGVLRFCSQRLR